MPPLACSWRSLLLAVTGHHDLTYEESDRSRGAPRYAATPLSLTAVARMAMGIVPIPANVQDDDGRCALLICPAARQPRSACQTVAVW